MILFLNPPSIHPSSDTPGILQLDPLSSLTLLLSETNAEEGRNKDSRRRHRSTHPTIRESDRQCRRHLLSRLITSLVLPPQLGKRQRGRRRRRRRGGIDCCKTVKTTNCGRERRGGGRRLGRRLRVPPPSAVKYIQEAFECV